jgi:hypothetical protein
MPSPNGEGRPGQGGLQDILKVVTKDNMNDPDVKPYLYKSSC